MHVVDNQSETTPAIFHATIHLFMSQSWFLVSKATNSRVLEWCKSGVDKDITQEVS